MTISGCTPMQNRSRPTIHPIPGNTAVIGCRPPALRRGIGSARAASVPNEPGLYFARSVQAVVKGKSLIGFHIFFGASHIRGALLSNYIWTDARMW